MFSPHIEPKHHIFLIDINQHFFSILSLIHNDISIMLNAVFLWVNNQVQLQNSY
jgi:hypothetical protein